MKGSYINAKSEGTAKSAKGTQGLGLLKNPPQHIINCCSTSNSSKINSDQKFTMGLIVSKYAQKIDFEEKKDKNIFTQVRFELETFGM